MQQYQDETSFSVSSYVSLVPVYGWSCPTNISDTINRIAAAVVALKPGLFMTIYKDIE